MRTRSGWVSSPSRVRAWAGTSPSGQTPSSSARSSSGRWEARTRSVRWWSNVGYRKNLSWASLKCLPSSRIPPFRSVRSCSPSASARTVTAHSLKATGMNSLCVRGRGGVAPLTAAHAMRAFEERQVPGGGLSTPEPATLRALGRLEDGSEVLVAEAEGPRGRQRLADPRRGGELDPGTIRLVEAQGHVLEHVVELEERVVAVFAHRPGLEPEHRRVARAGAHDLHEGVEVEALGIAGEERLGERERVGGGDGVVDELDALALADRPARDHELAHRVEQRPGALEVRRLAAHHDRERAVLGLGRGAGHGGVEEGEAARAELVADRPGVGGGDRAHVDAERPRLGSGGGAVLAEEQFADLWAVDDHRDHGARLA